MRLNFKSLGANFWARGFLRNCRREAKPLVSNVRELDRAIRRRAQELFDEGFDALPDAQGRSILGMCSLVLAANEEMERRASDSQATFDTVRRAFAATYPGPLVWFTRTFLWFTRDPLGSLKRRSLSAISRRMYGQSMEFAEEQTDETADMLVTHCAFHQFFVDHGRPELTVMVCAWDRAWMDAINRSRRPLRSERLSTISTGGDCCRFRFVRDADKRDPDPHDVVLVQLEVRREPSPAQPH